MPHDSHFLKRNLILNIISHLGPISRTELINLTDYRPASVSAIIKELLDEQLIVETGLTSVGCGRKRVLLEINKAHLCAIGLAFYTGFVTFLVAQIDGTVLHRENVPVRPGMPKETLIEQIVDRTGQLLRIYQDKNIVGIGIGEPLYDPTSYRPEYSFLTNYLHYNDWVKLSLKPRLEEFSGLRVETYSGVVLPAMVERHYGAAKGVDNFICVELSNGIGSSLCLNGIPVSGATGRAGELGHTVIDHGNTAQKLCFCGKTGCVEVQTAYPALTAQLSAAMEQGVFSSLSSHIDPEHGITVDAIRHALDEGDRMCMHYVKAISQKLGVVIANAVNLLNPQLVVLYGFMTDLGSYFLQQLEMAIRENTLSAACDFELRTSPYLEKNLPLGAVAEIFSSYLRTDDYKWVYQLQPSDLENNTNSTETGERL